MDLTWETCKWELITRFTNNLRADEALRRFLATREVDTFADYIKLLKDARVIKNSRGVSTEHIMRQVVARSPAGLKSLLLQIAGRGIQ